MITSPSTIPTLLQVMFGLFSAIAVVWALLLWKSKEAVFSIHYLMLALVIFKALTCMSQAVETHFLEISGTPDGWNYAYYFFTFFRGLLFFTVVVLIGTGWSYMKPFIDDNTKRILLIVIPLQVSCSLSMTAVPAHTLLASAPGVHPYCECCYLLNC